MNLNSSWRALGKAHYAPTNAAEASLQYRRSLYMLRDFNAGDVLTSENLRAIRSGLGLAPKFYADVSVRESAVMLEKAPRFRGTC